MRKNVSVSLDEGVISLVRSRAEKNNRSFSRQVESILKKYLRVK